MLTGLMLAARVRATGRSLRELAGIMTRLPQKMINVKGVDKNAVEANEPVQAAVAQATQELSGTGRVLLRKSGTEPVVRVMVEAQTPEEASAVCHRLADVVREHLSL